MKRKHPLHPLTAIINKNQKIQSQKIRSQALEWLATQFPEAFDNTKRIRPLKIGIMNDILQLNAEASTHGISRSKLREAVVLFTRRLDYLTCLKAQEMRVDLNGEITGEVSKEEAENAAAQIKKHIEKKLRNAATDAAPRKTTNFGFYAEEPRSTIQNPTNCISPPVEDSTMQPGQPIIYSNPLLKNTTTSSNILIKHKIVRTYDPAAVARLKEKLGLAQRKPE